MRVVRSKLSVCIFSCFIGLLLCEGIVRYLKIAPAIFDYKIFEPMVFVENPRICYKMKPYGECEGGMLNSEGFKDKNRPLYKDNDTIRIIMLGDSITKGSGINLGATFSDLLEKNLNLKLKVAGSNLKYEVMNFGVGGYNIVSEVEVLKVYGLKYKPDIVILNYFWNDNEEYSYNYWWFMENSDLSASEKNLIYQYYLKSNKFRLRRLLFASHLFRLGWVYANQLSHGQDIVNKVRMGDTYKEDIVSGKLSELKELGQRNNFITIVCLHPVLDYDRREPHPNYSRTKNVSKRLGFMCIDLIDYYKSKSPDPKIFLEDAEDRIHPNEAGHLLIANSILYELEKSRLVKFNE